DRFNYAQTNIGGGYFNFDNAYTASMPLGGTGGFGFASYLLGTVASGQITLPTFVAGQQIARAEFIGDTWGVTRKLTFNLGLRYEEQGPWSERYNRLTSFAPTASSTLQAPGLPLRGQFGLVSSPIDSSRNNFAPGNLEFAPRVGFAYQLTSQTVVRGGYGIFW